MEFFSSMRNKVLLAAAVIGVSFAAGRYTSKGTDTTTSQVKVTDNKVIDKDSHVKTVTTTVKKPDGTETTTTTTDKDTTSVTKDTSASTSKTTEVASSKSGTNISLMGGYNYRTYTPVYGASVSKELLGPVTMGIFGFTDGTVGATVGINF